VTDGVWTLTADGGYNVYTSGMAILRINNAITTTINIDV
jgi:hypothetical protein